MEDTHLILASREDPAAFRILYDRWAERLLMYFYVRVRDPEIDVARYQSGRELELDLVAVFAQRYSPQPTTPDTCTC